MIKFREANLDDIFIYFNWVNDPLVRFNSFNTNKITFSEHQNWFKRKVKDKNCLLLIFTVYNKPFGQVRFEKEEFNYWAINISISNEFIGKGYGSIILNLATKHFHSIHPKIIINAYIKITNIVSIKSFEKASFKKSKTLNYRGSESFKYILENEDR